MGRATLPLSEGFGALGRWVVGRSLRVLNYLVAIGPRGWRAEAAPKQGQAAFLFAGDLAGGGRAGPPPAAPRQLSGSRISAPLSYLQTVFSCGRVTVWMYCSVMFFVFLPMPMAHGNSWARD